MVPDPSPPGRVTELLLELSGGNRTVVDELIPFLYAGTEADSGGTVARGASWAHAAGDRAGA